MKILILGGSGFLGRHLVEAGLLRGHSISVFNRGATGGVLPVNVEQLRGDRVTGDYSSVAGRTWDAVVDLSAGAVGWMRGAVAALKQETNHYVFTSSVSAYRSGTFREGGRLESAEMETWPAAADEMDRGGPLYGAQKARCEEILLEALGERATVIRPGLIVGPGDPTDRFTYWPMRIARGGEVLAPGSPAAPMQVIDVRDLAEWIIGVVEKRCTGVFNAVGPETTMGEFLEGCVDALSARATLTWVQEEFLIAHKVAPWVELPLWISQSEGMAGFFQVSNRKARDAGLVFRPFAETVRATMQWARTRAEEYVWQRGVLPEKEARVLAAWRERLLARD